MKEKIRTILDGMNDGKKILVKSATKDKKEIVEQMLSLLARVSRKKMQGGTLGKNDWRRFLNVASLLVSYDTIRIGGKATKNKGYDLIVEV